MADPTAAAGYRYERKFVTAALDLAQIRALIRIHPALFSEIHQERHVNNIYFDTPALDHYEANVRGLMERLKCRVRWYGKLFGPVEAPVLELKCKKGLMGRKHAFSVPAFTLDAGFESAPIFENADLPERLALYLSTLQPTLLNRYRRSYYLSADGRYRITVDSDLEFFRIGARANRFGESSACIRRVVLELKYGPDAAAGASSVSTHLPIRLSKSSKYVVGIDALNPW